MTVDAQRDFRASMQSLPDAVAFVEAFCRDHDVAPNDALRLTLIIEELFTNTVQHGHGGDCDERVRVALRAEAMQVDVVYEDAAPPFDPLARLAQPAADLDVAADGRAPGGLGIVLVAQMARCLGYARIDGLNRVSLVLPRER